MTAGGAGPVADRARYGIVIPSIGRPSLQVLLAALARQPVGEPDRPVLVVVADDRRAPLDAAAARVPELTLPADLPFPVTVVRTGGRGPAAARNAGWRTLLAGAGADLEWIVFLDDDVTVPDDWTGHLLADLAGAAPTVGGVQSRLDVPLPPDRRPTDWERNTAALAVGRWITADMAYRRDALVAVHGFDERFPRAFREDADIAFRVQRAGWTLTRGTRTTVHPVRPAPDGISLRTQAGNADDALLAAMHGRRWREVTESGPGRTAWHLATAGAAAAAVGAASAGRSRLAAVAAAGWAALTVDFARRRIAPGPRPGQPGWAAEWRRMAWTSAVIPFAAVRHRAVGAWRHRRGVAAWPPPVRAVLFDRDGTLVHDVPYNGDPEQVRVVDGACAVLDDLRRRGIAVGMVSNQSGVARGLITADQVSAVNTRVQQDLGPLDTVQVCPHGPDDRCWCRKPEPLMVLRAAAALGVTPAECALIGDIGADVQAAVAAGARAVLVPTAVTRTEEIDAARGAAGAVHTAPDLATAVLLLALHGESGAVPGSGGVAVAGSAA
ncbi:HAD-IIIA family hydrolase [Nakamurella leprariae]|uniref:D,D-heptose 1,7-bisphosphate phosphatase n=1 Tax=Nakamurella leprariae TaxID=2803911 RepID=A0A939C128_9ACTN|nr:HAD-IIIA family hydrolase [Nakamurella leprariae]MBM9469376.1 HAD-IIIA family hydrolase [Nakamurella leprariae]